ncbi:hypothetical protein HPB48_009772 [Haemaphysalis longicornis]|uniref:Uncharacterized protein n=1 Tax=Haemaphysalis longicornis TaxID=44386 RepID=A0A9J6GQC4_HAELO|nr:hypothetical protein HPB48_009772 [Haemaphysalis longicornis]
MGTLKWLTVYPWEWDVDCGPPEKSCVREEQGKVFHLENWKAETIRCASVRFLTESPGQEGAHGLAGGGLQWASRGSPRGTAAAPVAGTAAAGSP